MSNQFVPSKKMREFIECEIGFFFHFGIRTFNEENRDWDLLPMDPKTFNPTDLDCDQWIQSIKAVGAKYAVMTTKHHDGFALWPSKYTKFSVASSDWRGGKGDVVREYTDACRRHGLKVGLYYSSAQFDTVNMDDTYDDFVIGQVTELLTNYGKIDYLWFDGCGSENHTFDRKRISDAIYALQPDIVCTGTFGTENPRWGGNEWCICPMNNNNNSEAKGYFSPAECDGCMTRIKAENFWFYNETHNDCRRTLNELVSMYYYSVGRGANILLNVAPDRRGRIQDEDIRLLNAARDEISRRMHGCRLHTGSIEPYTVDGKPGFRVQLDRPQLVDHVVLEEDLSTGNHIFDFAICNAPYPDCQVDIELYRGYTVGHKAIITFPAIRCQEMRFRIDKGDPEAALKSFKLLYVGSNLGNDQIVG